MLEGEGFALLGSRQLALEDQTLSHDLDQKLLGPDEGVWVEVS